MRKYSCKILLAVLITIQVIYTAYAFANWKEGLHSDEVWSYGFSNSHYRPFLALRDGIGILWYDDEDVINCEEWVSGEELRKYITVQEGERFAYDSVYYNNANDLHPPLFYMLLHTVCSFFPEKFSPWYGESLNLLFLAVTQVFLFLTIHKITKSEVTALAGCLLYGGSRGALLTFTFIRQYSMVLALCMMFVYFSACFYDSLIQKGQFSRKYAIFAAVTAWLSFLTHYHGIVFIGTFTACFCLYLLIRRKIGPMLFYGFSMLIALGCAFAVYPVAVEHFLGNWQATETSYSPLVQFKYLFNLLFRYDYGFGINYFPTAFWNITLPLLAAGIVVVGALLFPFRNEAWFPKLIIWLKDKVRELLDWLKNANYVPLFTVTAGIVVYGIVANSVDVLLMGAYVFRYISIAVPYFAMAVVILLQVLLHKIPKMKRWSEAAIYLIIGAVLIRVNVTIGYPYIYPQITGNVDLVSETAGKKVLVVDRITMSFITNITWFSQWLYRADSVCFTSRMTIEDTFGGGGGLDGRDADYMIVDTEVFRPSDAEKRELEARGGVTFGPEDGNPHVYAYTDGLKQITGNRDYEILTIQVGQRGTYYVLKFE